MRIVFITIFREGFGGGEGRVAFEIANYFAPHQDVVLICPGDHTGLTIAPNGLQVYSVKSASEGQLSMPALTTATINEIFKFLTNFNPHVVHAHDPALLGLIGQIWAKLHNVPFVHTTHVLPWKILDFGANDLVRFLGSFSERVAAEYLQNFYNSCDAVIALNSIVAEGIRRFGYDGRLFIIPNGRDLLPYNVCTLPDIHAKLKVLVFVGYLNSRKNQAYLIEMMRYLPRNYQLLLVGDALDPKYGEGLKQTARDYGLDNVIFTGELEYEEISNILERSHVFVSASKMEVQSLVIIEALASGTPVVGLSNETVDELIDSSTGFNLSKETAPQEFAEKVQIICNLFPTSYDRLCTNARQRVRNLDWSIVMESTISAYQELIDDQPQESDNRQVVELANIVSSLPHGKVRDFLTEQVIILDRSIKTRLEGTDISKFNRRVETVGKVPSRTWWFTGLTMIASVLGYTFLKLTARPIKKVGKTP